MLLCVFAYVIYQSMYEHVVQVNDTAPDFSNHASSLRTSLRGWAVVFSSHLLNETLLVADTGVGYRGTIRASLIALWDGQRKTRSRHRAFLELSTKSIPFHAITC